MLLNEQPIKKVHHDIYVITKPDNSRQKKGK